jgi:hydroxyproline O-galactosyltransferase HPGT
MFRQQGKRLKSLEMELAAAKHGGFVGKYCAEENIVLILKRSR